MAQRRFSEAEGERERKSCEKRNYGMVLYKTNRQLESHQMVLYHANQWASQAQMENRRMFEELAIKSRLSNLENYWEFAMKKRKELGNWGHMSLMRKRNMNPRQWISSCLRFKTLQDNVNALNEVNALYDPGTASSFGASHVPSQPLNIPSHPKGMLSRDSGWPHHTRNSMGTSRTFLKFYLLKKRYLRHHMELPWDREKEWDENRRVRQYRLQDVPGIMIPGVPCIELVELILKNCMREAPRYAISELHFGKFQDPDDFQCWRVNFKTVVCEYTVPSAHNVVDQWSGHGETCGRSDDVAINGRAKRFPWFWDAWCEDCVCVEKDHLQYLSQKESQCQKSSELRNTTDSWEGGRLPMWSMVVGFVQYLIIGWWRPRFRYKMGQDLTWNNWFASGNCPGRLVQQKSCKVPNNFWQYLRCTTKNWVEIAWRRASKNWGKCWDNTLMRRRGHAVSESEMKEWKRDYWSRVIKGENVSEERKVGDCHQWKANGQCSKGDSCSF